MKQFIVITLFPEMFEAVLNSSMLWKAQQQGVVKFTILDLREFGLGPRQQVDDTPYGGGDGMLLMVEPLAQAVAAAKQQAPSAKVVLLSPGREVWRQNLAQAWAASVDDYILLCGRYEGFDARIESLVDQKLSIGRFILTGGELPAMVLIDSVVRLLPGVLGGEQSAEIESYSDGSNLEYPQYTRPEVWRGLRVPEVLLSGHHGKIAEWRQENSEL